MKKLKFSLFITIMVVLLALTGCGSEESSVKSSHNEHEPSIINGDIREQTPSTSDLPSFLVEKPEQMIAIYTAAANHKELLENIPCYCGCGDSVGHKDSYDCFVNQNNEDGSLVWDDHGTKCGVCLEIAATSVVEYQEGKSIVDIRKQIDEMYKEGFAKPTPTPMPGS